MQFRTTTGGTTTLELDPHERDALHAAAGSRDGDSGGFATVRYFEQKQRENPLADFNEVLAIAFPPKPQAGVAPKRSKPVAEDPLVLAAALVDRIETAMRSSGSMQLSGSLYGALATLNQTQMLAERMDVIIELLEAIAAPPMLVLGDDGKVKKA